MSATSDLSSSNAAASAPKQDIKTRKVVTCFVMDEQRDLVLVLKRSDKVGSYRGRWAGVSGTLEESDQSLLHAAFREIQEETKLFQSASSSSAGDIRFVRRGEVFTVFDEKRNTNWQVHPHLFYTTHPSVSVQIDWEHSEFQWVEPWRLFQLDRNQESVPGLGKAFASVYWCPRSLKESVRWIEKDRAHGATQLGHYFLREILHIQILSSEESCLTLMTWSEIIRMIKSLAWAIMKARPSMRPIFAGQVSDYLGRLGQQPGFNPDGPLQIEYAKQALEASIDKVTQSLESLCQHGLYLIMHQIRAFQSSKSQPFRIMSISRSSTVEALLKQILLQSMVENIGLEIMISESRPLNEGADMLQSLASFAQQEISASAIPRGMPQFSLITESQIFHFTKDAQLILLGADRVLPDASVINKSGSAMLAHAGNILHVPVVAVTLESKFDVSLVDMRSSVEQGVEQEHEQEQEEEEEEKDAIEVTQSYRQELPSEIRVRNVYFEAISPCRFTSYITENGARDAESIKQAIQEAAIQLRSHFKEASFEYE